jgi:hypothetical protein
MMLAWSFAARTVDEVASLLRALGRHRYVREVDHRIHFSVDRALAPREPFASRCAELERRLQRERDLDLSSREPTLWRPATIDEVIEALTVFWTPGDAAEEARRRLLDAIAGTGLPPAEHAPFACPPDDPPHPELILLDWVLYPVDELDAERHAGALTAMEDSGDEVQPSTPVYQEGPILAAPELCRGTQNGLLPEDFLIWSDGPYSYADYVFRGATKAARLVDAAVGYRDI